MIRSGLMRNRFEPDGRSSQHANGQDTVASERNDKVVPSVATMPLDSLIPGPGEVERQRIAVVVNGNAKGVDDEVIASVDQILRGGDLFVSKSLEDAREIARILVTRGYGTVLTGGGDGTFTVMVSEVVREARRVGRGLPRFGLLKLGTGNAIAWVVGAGQIGGNWAADVRRLHEDAGSRTVRLIEVDGFIAPFCGFGADAEILLDYQWWKQKVANSPLRPLGSGALGYACAVVGRSLPSIAFRRKPHCRVVNTGADAYRIGARGSIRGPPIPEGEVLYEGPTRIVALSTIPYYGFGFRAFPFAEERSDRMHLRISTLGVAEFVRNFAPIWKGEFEQPDALFDYLVESVSITMDPPTPFQIGGDVRGVRERVDAVLSPQPIRLVDFYAPPNAS